MDVDLVYASKTGNTEKIAKAIAKEFRINPVKINKAKKKKYDFIIIGSPTHAFRPTEEIIKFIEEVEAKYAAVFSTHSVVSCATWMEKRLESRGIKVLGRFSCPGEFNPFRSIILNKGRPNINDIISVKHFVKLMKNKLKNPRLRK